jgi:type II secretory pathway pseudopilin PulG
MSAQDRGRLSDQAGFTLIELLWYMVLSTIVIGAPLYFIVTSINQQNTASSRAVAARQAEFGLQQMVRDLREAVGVDSTGATLNVTVSNPTSSTTAVSFYVPTAGSNSSSQQITWTCPSTGAVSVGNCTRQLGSGSGATSRTEITGVQSLTFLNSSGNALSLPATNPGYLGLKLSVQDTSQLDTSHSTPVTGATNPILIQTGVDLRNLS